MSANPREVAAMERVEALLARDLDRVRARANTTRRARIMARIERATAPSSNALGLRSAAGAAAALLLGALMLGRLDGAPPEAAVEEALASQQQPHESVLLSAPARPGFASGWVGKVRAGAVGLGASLELPMRDEARRMADDGARVAAAVLHRLPGPLRHALSGSARR